MSVLDEFPMDEVRELLGADSSIAYGLLFGSVARREEHARSDIDIALGGSIPPREQLALEHRLELLLGRTVQVVALRDAPPALRYRIFRDGKLLFERDRDLRIQDQARAITEYMDYRRLEETCARGVLARRTGAGSDLG